MTFRWDQWLQGAFYSGLVTAIAIAPSIVADGVTKPELWTLLSAFLGGIALYCKDHKPQ